MLAQTVAFLFTDIGRDAEPTTACRAGEAVDDREIVELALGTMRR